jgi:hypothetical protein
MVVTVTAMLLVKWLYQLVTNKSFTGTVFLGVNIAIIAGNVVVFAFIASPKT